MILYTTMPQELIYQTDESEYGKQLLIEYQGVPVLVELDENHDYRVIRVMSSDPNVYLNNSLSPGAVLTNKLSL